MTVDYDFERAKEVAATTCDYLGGHRVLTLMVGARDFSYDGEGALRFRFKGSRKANYVEFVVKGADLYDVRFWRITKSSVKKTANFEDVYFDQLRDVFEQATGLLITL